MFGDYNTNQVKGLRTFDTFLKDVTRLVPHPIRPLFADFDVDCDDRYVTARSDFDCDDRYVTSLSDVDCESDAFFLKMKVVSVASIVGMHESRTRSSDKETFIRCTFGDKTNDWVLRSSIIESDDALKCRLLDMEKNDEWPPMQGGRPRNLPLKGGAFAKKGDVLGPSRTRRGSCINETRTIPTNANAKLVGRVLDLERFVAELERKLHHLMLQQAETIQPCINLPTHYNADAIEQYPESQMAQEETSFMTNSAETPAIYDACFADSLETMQETRQSHIGDGGWCGDEIHRGPSCLLMLADEFT